MTSRLKEESTPPFVLRIEVKPTEAEPPKPAPVMPDISFDEYVGFIRSHIVYFDEHYLPRVFDQIGNPVPTRNARSI